MPDELSPGLGSADGLTAEERACIPEALIEQKMLSFRGRIGRAVFWGRLFAALICVAFAATSTSMIVYLIPDWAGTEAWKCRPASASCSRWLDSQPSCSALVCSFLGRGSRWRRM